MATNILHIWGPEFKNRFGGAYILWKYAYENWNESSVCHNILDYEDNSIKKARSLIKEKNILNGKNPNKLKRFLWAINLLWFLTRNKNKYDVLHVHILLWGGLLIALWAKRLGKAVVYESVLEGSDNPSSIKKERLGNVKLWCLRHFTKIIAISNELANDYRNYGIPVVMIPSFVDTFLFSPSKTNSKIIELRRDIYIPEQAQVLLFVGSVIYRKGIDVLVNLFIRMAEERPNLFLLVVGPKTLEESKKLNMEYIQSIYSLLQSKQLMERAKFIGLVEEKSKIAEYYKLADIFVFPTRQEGLPNVVLEAAASQLPIVVTHLLGIEDIIQDKINGLFVPKDNIDAFVEAVSLILDNSSFARELATNARVNVMMKFTYNKWQSNLINCYNDLLQ